MKKLLGGCILAVFLMLFPFTAYGQSLGNQTPKTAEEPIQFEITNGLTRESEPTFDDKRSISISVEPGTEVVLYVYSVERIENFKPSEYKLDESKAKQIYSSTVVVGESGLYYQTIDIEIGDNIVQFLLQKDKKTSVERYYLIRRKRREVKVDLEQGRVIPGEGRITPTLPTTSD